MDFLSDLIEEIVEDLAVELEDDVNYSETLLTAKVTANAREVLELRNYPSAYSDDMKLADMENMYSKIRGRSLYDYNQIGAEGETHHSEKNISRTYRSKNALYPIIPLTRLV